MMERLPRRGAFQIDLDHLGWTRSDQEEQPDVRPALEEPVYDPVEFVVDIRDSGQVALGQDRRGETRFGEDHDAGGRLKQMGAGSGAHNQEKRVLNLPVQPDDAGQPTEDFALSTFAKDRRGLAAHDGHRSLLIERSQSIHGVSPDWTLSLKRSCELCSKRATRNFSTNCAALTT